MMRNFMNYNDIEWYYLWENKVPINEEEAQSVNNVDYMLHLSGELLVHMCSSSNDIH
jgi:hypothetical protein